VSTILDSRRSKAEAEAELRDLLEGAAQCVAQATSASQSNPDGAQWSGCLANVASALDRSDKPMVLKPWVHDALRDREGVGDHDLNWFSPPDAENRMSGGVGVTGWLVPPRHFDPIPNAPSVKYRRSSKAVPPYTVVNRDPRLALAHPTAHADRGGRVGMLLLGKMREDIDVWISSISIRW